MTFTIGSLCTGLGMLDLGLSIALGAVPRFMVEIDPFCQRVLRARFPGVTLYEDVRDVGTPARPLPRVDIMCAGWPCQGNSLAGLGRGLADERSGLWFEVKRIVDAVEPGLFVGENVPGIRRRGLDVVVEGLAASGYDLAWDVLSAAHLGAPHLRRRVFIVAWRPAFADAHRRTLRDLFERFSRRRAGFLRGGWQTLSRHDGALRPVADTDSDDGGDEGRLDRAHSWDEGESDAADTDGLGRTVVATVEQEREHDAVGWCEQHRGDGEERIAADAAGARHAGTPGRRDEVAWWARSGPAERCAPADSSSEPGRVAGLARVDGGVGSTPSDADSRRCEEQRLEDGQSLNTSTSGRVADGRRGARQDAADANDERREERVLAAVADGAGWVGGIDPTRGVATHADSAGGDAGTGSRGERGGFSESCLAGWDWRLSGTPVRRVHDVWTSVDGVDRPRRRRSRPVNDPHRLHALGNAVVPQCAYVVGIWALRLMLSDEMPRRQGATP